MLDGVLLGICVGDIVGNDGSIGVLDGNNVGANVGSIYLQSPLPTIVCPII